MKELTPEQIHENWVKLINLIKDTFSEEYPDNRREKLLNMYQYFEDRMCVAPASGREHFHYAHVGGYVEHVLHVVDCAVQLKELWEKNGATINFTDEELIFAAMHHDLGKVGDMNKDYYVPQDSEWHRKNKGEIFTHNDALQYMTVTDRAIFLLNQFGIKMTEWEYVGLRLTDGLYEEANKSYYISYNKDWALKSNIAYILHQADSMATHIEYDEWKRGEEEEEVRVQGNVENIKKAVTMEETSDQLSQKSKDLFNELFGDK
jgi:predicted HD phosphohydrolase